MDKIELVVTHQMGGPVDRLWSAVFGMAGGTIGRAGQNKLVLPDSDAEVARVHAMVRLDSDQAYIANLCERRSVLVNGMEVLSGQEVPLLPGADVGIGPYQLRALLPGEPRGEAPSRGGPLPSTSVNALPLQHPPSSISTGLAPAEATPLNLSSLPNPWADIPATVGGESYMPELADLQATDQPTGPADASSDNPFAMLGRVEPTDADQPMQKKTSGAAQMHRATAAASLTEPQSMQINSNVPFEKHGPKGNPSGLQTPEHRAMMIPDDFDPFAADPKARSNSNDAWSGDLAAKSLAEVAPLKNDELLQSLPHTNQFAGEMDSAAHTGLPKQLDPAVELNPMKLFREPGESICNEVEDHGLSRGSDLAQIFSMPREVRSGSRSDLALSESKATESAVAAGLLPTMGLDLALFGAADSSTSSDLAFLNVCDAKVTDSPALPAQAPATRISTSRADGTDEANPLQPQNATASTGNFKSIDTHAPAGLSAAVACQRLEDQAPTTSATQNISREDQVSTSVQALTAAFLKGAGIRPDGVKLSITPEFMHGFGEALRTAVQGSIDLLSARSEIKREFRADVTIIASGANNPLKFLPTADGVMLQLIGQTFPGFMKPVPAMKEAYKDLAVHQIALMAGIRAAYAEATARLSPVELEKSAAASPSLFSKISSTHRKAALWDDYQQRYESIRRHAEDDLMAFSGKTFVDAYENAAQADEGPL